MNINDFIQELINQYNFDISVEEGLKAITKYAQTKAKDGCACLSEDDVRDYFVSNIDEIKKDIENAKAKEQAPKVTPRIEIPIAEKVEKVKKESKYENLSLF